MPMSKMRPKIIRGRKRILRPAKKVGVVILILFQFTRLFCIGSTMYFIYNAIGSGTGQIASFDEVMPTYSYEETATSPPSDLMPQNIANASANANDDTNAKLSASDSYKTFQELLLVFVPILEIFVSLVITYLVIGPLSPKVTIKRWIMWLFKMRIFWMRFVWTLTGATYAIVYIQNRKLIYQQTELPEYLDDNLVIVALTLTALEYGCLGMVESIVKLVKVETIENRLRKHDRSIRGFWKKMCMFGYYMCLLAYALRSFSMSLYFGILSVVSSSDESKLVVNVVLPPGSENLTPDEMLTAEQGIKQQLKLHGAIVVVLQIYLAIIRGKFYGFFMHNLLSNFLYEADSEYFQDDLSAEIASPNGNDCLDTLVAEIKIGEHDNNCDFESV